MRAPRPPGCNNRSCVVHSNQWVLYVCLSTGEYYSLSCEPTLGESQIFHSMIKRQPIRTRDAIKLIGDGQEQKLKKDRVIESWIKVKFHTYHSGCHATFLLTKAPKHRLTSWDCASVQMSDVNVFVFLYVFLIKENLEIVDCWGRKISKRYSSPLLEVLIKQNETRLERTETDYKLQIWKL